MRLWLPDGSIDPEAEVEALEFMFMPQRVERAIKQWDRAAESNGKRKKGREHCRQWLRGKKVPPSPQESNLGSTCRRK